MSPQKFQQSINVELKVDYNLNSINSDIFDQLIKVQQLIKNSQISAWCDHIPEWQMLVTNLFQYLFTAEDIYMNTANSKYLQETLQYYDKIKDYFNNDEIREQLYILFELIKQELAYKENFNLINYEYKELLYSCLYSFNYSNRIMFYHNKVNKFNFPVNPKCVKYNCNMQTVSLKNKFSNILNLNIMHLLLNKFS